LDAHKQKRCRANSPAAFFYAHARMSRRKKATRIGSNDQKSVLTDSRNVRGAP
jgi:hypothetical protein